MVISTELPRLFDLDKIREAKFYLGITNELLDGYTQLDMEAFYRLNKSIQKKYVITTEIDNNWLQFITYTYDPEELVNHLGENFHITKHPKFISIDWIPF